MLSAILALLLSVLCVVGLMNHTYSEQDTSSENKTVIETAKDNDVVVKQDNTQQGLTQNTTTITGKTEDIWFYKKNTTYNVQFQFSNMFQVILSVEIMQSKSVIMGQSMQDLM